MTSQKFLFQNGTSYRDSKLSKTQEKSLFMPENIFPSTNLYPPLNSHAFVAKQIPYVQLFETSHFKNNSSKPPPTPGESILLEFC